eukprot:g1394.t1
MLSKVKAGAQGALQKGADAAQSTALAMKGAAEGEAARGGGAAEMAKAGVAALGREAASGARAVEARVRETGVDAAVWIADKAVDAAAKHAKASLKDPYMPKTVERTVHSVIDGAIVPDLREVARNAAASKVRRELHDERIFAQAPGWCSPDPVRWLRAQLLYHLFPHDKSIFGKMRDPIWWLLMCAASFPLLGVSQAFWLVVFLAKDKSDEFQLVAFIVQCKVSQFVALGIGGLIVGAVQAAQCYTDADSVGGETLSPCSKTGPGSTPGTYIGLLFTILQVLLGWFAAAMLPRSTRKGGRLFAALSSERSAREGEDGSGGGGAGVPQESVLGNDADAKGALSRKGGRVVRLLLLDLVAFVGCGAAAYVVYDGSDAAWVKRSHWFWLRTLYGLCALPWLLLKLPLAFTLVLHVTPTAYNRRGETVRRADGAERERIAARDHAAGGCCGRRVAPLPPAPAQ